jgi:hypothetical protein
MGTLERATRRRVDPAIWALISKLSKGGWHSCGGGLPQSAEQAFGICHRAKLIDAEVGSDGTERYRLTAVGTALKGDYEGIVAAVRGAYVAGSQSADPQSELATYRKSDLVGELGSNPTTVTKYTKAAGVTVARRGKGNHRYTAYERLRIYQAIVDGSSDTKLVAKCRSMVAAEIVGESKDWD